MAFSTIVVLFVAAVGFEISSADTCPEFGEWKPWTECLWYPMQNIYDKMTASCGLPGHRNLTNILPLPPGFTIPPPCGHCSFKTRCRTRPKKEGCYPFDGEREICHEHGDICTIAKLPGIGCGWTVLQEVVKQCLSRPDIPEYMRAGYKKLFHMLPKGHCIEKDNQCKCCCGDYEPNEDGTECVKQQDHQCAPFNEPGDWSECLWFPLADMFKKVQSHCGVEGKPDGLTPSSLAPAGFQIPEKCGFCSFRLKCQSREKKEGCFPLKVDKKSCGAEDCPTCGDVCTLDKQNNSCAFTKAMGMKFWNSFAHKAKESNLAHWRRDGYADLFKFLPYGHCKEVGDKCKCCCHPYEPNEDGTACVVKQYCKSLEETGGKKQQQDQPESEKKAENMPETTGNASHHQHRHHHGDSSSESHEQHHHHHHH